MASFTAGPLFAIRMASFRYFEHASDLVWAKHILFRASGANRPNSGNRVAIDESLFQGDLKRAL
jgi:hypothetical protein